MDENGGVDSEE